MEASDPGMIRAGFARVREGGTYAEKLAMSRRDHHLMSEDQARSNRMDPFYHERRLNDLTIVIPGEVEDQIEKAWTERGQLRPVLGPVC
jgi:hypothetical protein